MSLMQIPVANFTKTLRARLEAKQRQAIRAWLRAVIAKTPSYTGTVRGTFKPLARVLGQISVQPGSVSKGAKAKIARGTKIDGQHYQLGFGAGGQYSDYSIEQEVSTFRLSFIFIFDSSLPYALWNNIQPAPSWIHLKEQTPWHALRAGALAFEQYVQKEVPIVMGDFGNLIKIRKVVIG
jgi:hypothetical protein